MVARVTSGGVFVETQRTAAARVTAGGIFVETQRASEARITAGAVFVEYTTGSASFANAQGLTIGYITPRGLSVDDILIPLYSGDVHGVKFYNDGATWLRVYSTALFPVTVTVHPGLTVDQQLITPSTFTVAAAGDSNGLDFQDIGPFTGWYDYVPGWLWFTFAATWQLNRVRVAAVRMRYE